VRAVHEVSFVAADGRITALLGLPNGAGKSTTLRMLCTVLRPDTGAALIDGAIVADDPLAARRHIGVLSHSSDSIRTSPPARTSPISASYTV
jgi:sodium transport system ATP-binding protein